MTLSDGEVAEQGHGVSDGAEPGMVVVFGEEDVPDPVDLVLDSPVSAGVVGDACAGDGLGGQVRDAVDDVFA
ncbi:hypothetical protein [Micromonospora sp. NBC_01638]|uniref:hypothetical protein n=1 Tax=Micromonospora sp. NBC_01638 TaxID=2975982 RepID=UPI003866FB09|nr:hypothetical protein OG811_09585 [Micromonospora sp. NBC_01638]